MSQVIHQSLFASWQANLSIRCILTHLKIIMIIMIIIMRPYNYKNDYFKIFKNTAYNKYYF